MRWNVVRLADVAPQRWRNGGGTTRQLLALPQADDWALRISVAEVVADGPFSPFPGVKRWFAVLGGGGVELRIGEKTWRLARGDPPFPFDGGFDTACKLLGGPTQDLNLMVRRRKAVMHRVSGSRKFTYAARRLAAVYANEESVVLLDGLRLDVPPASLAWRVLDEGAQVELQGDDALWMEIEP